MFLEWEDDNPDGPSIEVRAGRGRLPTRIYASKSFTLSIPSSRDNGQSARYVTRVFDDHFSETTSDLTEVEEHLLQSTPAGRRQIKVQVVREAGNVRQIEIQRIPGIGEGTEADVLLRLDRAGSVRLIELVRSLDDIPVVGQKSARMEETLLQEILRDPDAANELYRSDPEVFRDLITNDATAHDVVAIARRRTQVERFRTLLASDEAFELERRECAGSSERVWQRFFEDNPWILGVGLSGQLLTSWNEQKLEQVVAGYSVASPGKRTDALLRTSGRIRSMVFAEIKHHRTALVSKEYRPGCWAPSDEVSGGVTQVHQTLHLATQQIGERLADLDPSGAETGEWTHLLRPRAYLLVGTLDQLRGTSGVNRPKFRSFELFRRHLHEPEIVTFDELLARAEWSVSLHE